MDWIRDFYQKQASFLGQCYLGDVDDFARKKGAIIQQMIEGDQNEILDLGEGGGQNAVAMAQLGC